jgi:hypothetical protein
MRLRAETHEIPFLQGCMEVLYDHGYMTSVLETLTERFRRIELHVVATGLRVDGQIERPSLGHVHSCQMHRCFAAVR